MTGIAGILGQAAGETPERVGWISGDREIGFAEMDAWADRFADWLLARGVRRGDRIAVNSPNSPDWLAVYFAAARVGAVLVGLSPRYGRAEFVHMLRDSGARLLITVAEVDGTDFGAVFAELRAELPALAEVASFGADGVPTLDSHASLDGARLAAAEAEVTDADPVMIIYTSGTTGDPKGAVLTQEGQLAAAEAQARHTRLGPEDVLPVAVPLNHVSGITCGVLACLFARARAVLLARFDPAEVLGLFETAGLTVWVGVPTMHTLLLRRPEFAGLDTSGVRMVITGGSNAEPALVERLTEAFPNAVVLNLYGLSEVAGAVIMTPWEAEPETTVHAIGEPLPGVRCRIVDSEGTEFPDGQTGELWVRTDSVMAGYHARPEATAEVLAGDGWLRTGDLALRDERGAIVLRGRAKDMFVQGGFNIYPVEVENLLTEHPEVIMAAGVGVPDPVLGEIGRYYVTTTEDSGLTEESLRDYCAERIADYKVPKQIVFRTELPLTSSGKIRKAALRETEDR